MSPRVYQRITLCLDDQYARVANRGYYAVYWQDELCATARVCNPYVRRLTRAPLPIL
ncbi:MAG: hypothetical protein ACFFDN_20810 [Candidatus Hodarchaeota archaeon]